MAPRRQLTPAPTQPACGSGGPRQAPAARRALRMRGRARELRRRGVHAAGAGGRGWLPQAARCSRPAGCPRALTGQGGNFFLGQGDESLVVHRHADGVAQRRRLVRVAQHACAAGGQAAPARAGAAGEQWQCAGAQEACACRQGRSRASRGLARTKHSLGGVAGHAGNHGTAWQAGGARASLSAEAGCVRCRPRASAAELAPARAGGDGGAARRGGRGSAHSAVPLTASMMSTKPRSLPSPSTRPCASSSSAVCRRRRGGRAGAAGERSRERWARRAALGAGCRAVGAPSGCWRGPPLPCSRRR